jgi:hypothetical protein
MPAAFHETMMVAIRQGQGSYRLKDGAPSRFDKARWGAQPFVTVTFRTGRQDGLVRSLALRVR